MVVEFENIASVDARRITWPISVSPITKYENVDLAANNTINDTWEVKFSNKINGNKNNQFPALVIGNQSFNLNFTHQPPRDMRFQIQRT